MKMHLLPHWRVKMLAVCIAASFWSGCATVGMALMIWPVVIIATVLSLPLMPYYLAVEGLPERRGAEFATFMPDGNNLLCGYKHGRDCCLYRVGLDGAEWSALTTGNRFDFDPEFSPDGSRIVFASRVAPRTSNLFMMDNDGGNLRSLTTGKREDWSPRFSPDGKHIVFCSYTGKKQADLFVVDVDGTNLVQVTNDGNSHDVCPAFLSDSETIVFARGNWWGHTSPIASSSWHRFDIYTTNIKGVEPTKLTRECFYSFEGLLVLPNNSRIVAIACDTVTTFTRASSGELTTTTDKLVCDSYNGPCGKNAGGFSLSPDSERMIFMTSDWDLPESRQNAIHIAPLNTLKAEVVLESEHRMIGPRISPDGSQIVYRVETHPTSAKTNLELWIANIDGSNPRRIDDTAIDTTQAEESKTSS